MQIHPTSKLNKRILAAVVTTVLSSSVWADSPPNITNDIKWMYSNNGNSLDINGASAPPPTYGSVAIIEAAFNNARRQEETQLGLTLNTITDLDLPSQSDWDGMTDDQKALFLVNAERTSRDGMLPNVIGLPFAGVESAVDMISDTYANVLINNNVTGHYQPSGNPSSTTDGFFSRLAASPTLSNCYTNIARGENLAWYGVTAGTSIPLMTERAIYQWMYDDSSSNWAHREMILLQDKPLSGNSGLVGSGSVPGFTNDNGSNAHEGYIGFSNKGSVNYQPFTTTVSYAHAIVLQFFDPKPSASCSFTVTDTTESLAPGAGIISMPSTTSTSTSTNTSTSTSTGTSSSSGGGSFGLFGIGLFGLMGLVRRKLKIHK
ncbi:MAG: hypothetical protein ACPG47_06025 [Leucothrix sp.]